MNVSGDTLQLRNKVSQILYNAVLDYKAALFAINLTYFVRKTVFIC